MPQRDSPALRYHDGTKHHFDRFARSLGYLDWASQPAPFRSFHDAQRVALYPSPAAPPSVAPLPAVTYPSLLQRPSAPAALSAAMLGDLLRHALGLSAWKSAGRSRWSLRVNPSSGNLHPTEAYVLCGAIEGLQATAGVYHYAADAHALELRCAIDAAAWSAAVEPPLLLVGLSSIHWRESWKYGERAFRYCQHDIGHAIAALAVAAAMHGWDARLLAGWAHADIAAVFGLDRDADFVEAEREEPACVLALCPSASDMPASIADDAAAARVLTSGGVWSGRASQLSEDHIDWSFIDEVAAATRGEGRHGAQGRGGRQERAAKSGAAMPGAAQAAVADATEIDARALVCQRRSAVAFDPRASWSADRFFACLRQVLPTDGLPWKTMWWPPAIHLLVFVHRVNGVEPGLYLLPREHDSGVRLLALLHRDGTTERLEAPVPLVRLAAGDCRSIARRLCCDQDIAADGFFSLGMLADCAGRLEQDGESFYRQLFWEAGVVGQVLYLDAESTGARGTGIGCFYDDAVHALIGLNGSAFQSLYHFTIGASLEDRRLTTQPGYAWEEWAPRVEADAAR